MKYNNFQDIPRFIGKGYYQVDVGLAYAVNWIKELQTPEPGYGSALQLLPDFQRGHVWTEQQQIDYVEYLLRGGESGTIIYFNHPGWMHQFEGEFVIVDGLQRITAVTRFIDNEIKVFGSYYKDFKGFISMDCRLKFNINNLQTRKEVLEWYLQMNSGGTPHTQQELDKVKEILKKEK